jgi:hypothetical protein
MNGSCETDRATTKGSTIACWASRTKPTDHQHIILGRAVLLLSSPLQALQASDQVLMFCPKRSRQRGLQNPVQSAIDCFDLLAVVQDRSN